MSLEHLLKSGKKSDCTVRCGEKEWNNHEVILGGMSEYFETAFDSGFKEGITGDIVLDEDPKHVEIMIEYIYGNRSSGAIYSLSAREICDLHAAMDKYLVKGFAESTANTFCYRARFLLDTHKDVAGFVQLFSHALEYPSEQVVEIIDCLKQISADHAEHLIAQACFRPLVDQCEGLGSAFIKKLTESSSEDGLPTVVRCSGTCRVPSPAYQQLGVSNWTFLKGPQFLEDSFCIVCGGNKLTFVSHTWPEDRHLVRLSCTSTGCKSAGQTWTISPPIQAFNLHDKRPFCIWCGGSGKVQVLPRFGGQHNACQLCSVVATASK